MNYYNNNRDKAVVKMRIRAKCRYDKDPSNAKFQATMRKRHIKIATPPWSDRKELRRIYRECPKGQHVDHIIPLRAKNVCGLHVPYNLQYLSAEDNMHKHNRL